MTQESILPKSTLESSTTTKNFDSKKFLSFVSAALISTSIYGIKADAKELYLKDTSQSDSISNNQPILLTQNSKENNSNPTQAMANLIKESKLNKEILNQVSIKLDLSSHTLTVSKGSESVITYPIAVGARKLAGSDKDWRTPTGNYKIEFKTVNPDRKDPRKSKKSCVINGPTGCYFMNFKTEYTQETNTVDFFGIHGTFKDESIGKSASHGCVRMHNKDIQNLFQIIQVGTDVEIVE